MKSFFDIDFDSIYPRPTPERVAIAFMNRLWCKLHKYNFSLLITFYGPHRTGKSLTAVDFAYILDETFEDNLEDRVVYDGKGLVTAFKTIRKNKIKGGAVIVDEAGSGELSSSRWYEEAAKIINAELQAVGYLNPFVGFVTQSFSFINTTARRLSQGVFRVKRTNNEYAMIKPFWISDNPWSSGVYHKYPIFCESHNNVVSNIFKINRIKIGLPPEHILRRYQKHSQTFKDKLLVQSEEDMEMLDTLRQQKKASVSSTESIAREVFDNIDDYLVEDKKHKDSHKIISMELIRHHHEVSFSDAKLIRTLVEHRLNKK